MAERDDLARLLEDPRPQSVEHLLAHSALNRAEDIAALARVFDLVEGLERGAGELSAFAAELAVGDPRHDARLRMPMLRGWLADFGRIIDWTDASDAQLERQLDMTANMRWSLADDSSWTAVLAVEQGVLATADGEIALGGIPGDLAGVSKAGQCIAVIDENGTRHDFDLADPDNPRILRVDPLPGIATRVRTDLPWLRLSLREGAVPTREEGFVPFSYDRPEPYYPAGAAAAIAPVVAILAQVWPERHWQLGQIASVIVPRTAPPGWTVSGFTISSRQGALWLDPGAPLDVFEALIHEQAHVMLRYIEEAIPILATEQTEQMFRVSWRDDPRPVVGIVEGVYVHLQIAFALERALAKGFFSEDGGAAARARADDAREDVAEALELLREHARFTAAGPALIDWADRALGLEAPVD